MHSLTCQQCGISFQSKWGHSKVCGAACRKVRHSQIYAQEKKGPFEVHCVICKSGFVSRSPAAKYCCECKRDGKHLPARVGRSDLPVTEKTCKKCGEVFSTAVPEKIYCSPSCRAKFHNQQASPTKKVREPVGRYVYAWYSELSPLPFYVGKGVGSRMVDRHTRDDGTPAYCQRQRQERPGFRYEVVRQNLTEEGAALVEATLIKFVKSLGGCECNVVSGSSRRETQPLTLYQNASDVCGSEVQSLAGRSTPDCPPVGASPAR